jgi:hypothetical protein
MIASGFVAAATMRALTHSERAVKRPERVKSLPLTAPTETPESN